MGGRISFAILLFGHLVSLADGSRAGKAFLSKSGSTGEKRVGEKAADIMGLTEDCVDGNATHGSYDDSYHG